MAISRAQTGKQLSGSKKNRKVRTVMSEYKKGKLRSGSKKGPKVTNPKQAVAIAMSEGRKAARRRA